MTCRPAATAASRGRSPAGNRFTVKTVAFWLVAFVLLADAIRVAECRSVRQKRQYPPEKNPDYQNDGSDGNENEESDGSDDEGGEVESKILTTGLTIDVNEGTTITLPCKVPAKVALQYAVMWINGTKSIMTDSSSMTTDPRVKPGNPAPSGSDFADNDLIIEQVTHSDSGTYTCRISSTTVMITHTLRVTHPATVVSLQAKTSNAKTPNVTGVKKLTVKQGDAVQLICNVAGYPEPTVQWTKRVKQPVSPSGSENSQGAAPQMPATTVVSNTNEVRIDSANGHRDAGYYECTAHNSVMIEANEGSPSNTAHSGLDLEIDYPPVVTVPRLVVNTGETYTAQMTCLVSSYPKPKVTWEKEQNGTDGSTSWRTLGSEGPNSRYGTSHKTNAAAAVNGSSVPVGTVFMLKVKQVQGPQDFGRYRCVGENRIGSTYSDIITLTGTPGRPQSSFVGVKSGTSELGWTVDSGSPLAEYQLQYKKQQDSQTSWVDVRPQPQVVETSSANGAGDELRYNVSYMFGNHHQAGDSNAVQPPVLPPGTYVGRLRARNVHGWSEWSNETVFSGGTEENEEANEIHQNNSQQQTKHDQILKTSVGGNASGASGPRQYCSATIALAVSAMVIAAASVC